MFLSILGCGNGADLSFSMFAGVLLLHQTTSSGYWSGQEFCSLQRCVWGLKTFFYALRWRSCSTSFWFSWLVTDHFFAQGWEFAYINPSEWISRLPRKDHSSRTPALTMILSVSHSFWLTLQNWIGSLYSSQLLTAFRSHTTGNVGVVILY